MLLASVLLYHCMCTYDKHQIHIASTGSYLHLTLSYTAGSRDFNSSVRVVRFKKGDSEVSTCITLYDDQLREGDEVFSVLLSVPNVTTLEPGKDMLAKITIMGMCTYVCMSVMVHVRFKYDVMMM